MEEHPKEVVVMGQILLRPQTIQPSLRVPLIALLMQRLGKTLDFLFLSE